MTPPESDVLNFIKDFLWAPVLGLISWAWHRNEKEHEALRKAHEQLKDNNSSDRTIMSDKFKEHVEVRVSDAIRFAREEDLRLMDEMTTQRGHIAKIFDKLEEHARRSEDRHVEMLGAIHEGLSRKADK